MSIEAILGEDTQAVGLKYSTGTMLTNSYGVKWEVLGYYTDNRAFYNKFMYRLKQHPPINENLDAEWFTWSKKDVEQLFWPDTEIGQLIYGR